MENLLSLRIEPHGEFGYRLWNERMELVVYPIRADGSEWAVEVYDTPPNSPRELCVEEHFGSFREALDWCIERGEDEGQVQVDVPR